MYTGIGASAGIGIGSAVIVKEPSLAYDNKAVSDVDAEKKRLAEALDKCIAKTQAMADDMKERVGEKEAEILEGHVLLLMDPEMTGQMETSIADDKMCAEAAVEKICDYYMQMFSSIDDEMFQQRATDVCDIKTRLLKILLDVEDVDLANVPEGTVLVAEDLTPSMTAGINPKNVTGILTEVGGKTSHSAILARALEIPAVLSIPGITEKISNGDKVVLDGSEGQTYINPDEKLQAEYEQKRVAYLEEKAALAQFVGKETKTADGVKVELCANIGKPEDALKVVECDGEGIGLFRTEFLFMDRPQIPTEEEQFAAYKKVAETLEGKPVIIRTLDVGGDKEIPYLALEKEENPFLGFRAIRLCLKREDLYRPQLKALLRASAYGDIRIMVPMVTCLDELRAVKNIHLFLHTVFLIEEPPAGTKLYLTRNRAILEVAQHSGNNFISARIEVIKNSLRQLAFGIQAVEEFRHCLSSSKFTDRIETSISTEQLEHLTVIVTDSAIVELLCPAFFPVHFTEDNQHS